MHHARATTGEAFRSMLWVTVIIAAVLGGSGWLVFSQVQNVLNDQIKARIVEDFALVSDAHSRGGEQGMVEFITWATATSNPSAFVFSMFTDSGIYMTGAVKDRPAFQGWGRIDASSPDADPLLAFVAPMGDHTIVVGRSLRIVRTTTEAIVQALAISGLGIAVAGLATAFAFSRGTSFRLRTMARTLEQVARGNSEIRLPISRRNDQIDFVSRQVNVHLDRLAELMATMRNTAIAIAHDLRSPLNRVSIILQDVEASEDPQAALAAIETVHKELDGLKGVLDTILRISRIEASGGTSGFETFELTDTLADLVETFEPVMEANGQTIRFVQPNDVVSPVYADRRMIQQLLVNLIENAGRYAGKGAHVELALYEGDGAPIVAVSDNGPGIPEDKRASVFEPFFRMNPERNALGTGLGLALVHAIASRHRARVTLSDNAPGLRVTIAFSKISGLQGLSAT